jgi:hypothetical protein
MGIKVSGFTNSGSGGIKLSLSDNDKNYYSSISRRAQYDELEEEKRRAIEESEKAKKTQRSVGLNVLSFIQNAPGAIGRASTGYLKDTINTARNQGAGQAGAKVFKDASDFIVGSASIIQDKVVDTRLEANLQNVKTQEANKLITLAQQIKDKDPARSKRLLEMANKDLELSDKLKSDLELANKGAFGTNIGLGEAAAITGMVGLDVVQFLPFGAIAKIGKGVVPSFLADDLLKNAPKWVQSVKTGIKYATGADEIADVTTSSMQKGFKDMFQTSIIRGSLSGSTQGTVDSLSVFDSEDVEMQEKFKLVAQNAVLGAVVGTLFDIGLSTVGKIGGQGQKILDEAETKKYIQNFKDNNPSSLDVGNLAYDASSLDKITEARFVVNEFAKMEGREVLGETVGLSKEAPELYRYAKESFLDPVIEKSQKGEPVTLIELQSAVEKTKQFLQAENIQTMTVSVIDPQTRSKLDDLKAKIVEGEDITPQDLRIHDNVPIETNRNGVELKFDDIEGKRVRYSTQDGVELKGAVEGNTLKLDSGRDIELTPEVKDRILNNFDIEGVNTSSKFQVDEGGEITLVRGVGTGKATGVDLYGKGLYLTDSEDVAKTYGDKVESYTVKGNIFDATKPLNKKEFDNIIQGIEKKINVDLSDYKGSYTDDIVLKNIIDEVDSNIDFNAIDNYVKKTGVQSEERNITNIINDVLKDEGYVGLKYSTKDIEDLESLGLDNQNAFVIFDKKAVNQPKFQTADPLIEEARKYESAEEFYNAKGFDDNFRSAGVRGLEQFTNLWNRANTDDVLISRYKSAEEFARAQSKKRSNYKDGHRAPGWDSTPVKEKMEDGGDFSLDEISRGFSNQPDDYFDPKVGARYYSYDSDTGRQSYKSLKPVLDGKSSELIAYRAVPKNITQDSLIDGDWITFSKKYAEQHGLSRFDGEYKIIEQKVNKKNVWWDGNDINEWGFDTNKDWQKDIEIWNQANNKFQTKATPESIKLNKDEISTIVNKYFDKDEINVQFVDAITTPRGEKALGVYFDEMIKFSKDANSTTPEHEVLHAYFDMFTPEKRRASVLEQVKKTQSIDNDLDAEEWLADSFVDFARNNKKAETIPEKIKQMFTDVWEGIKSLVGKEDKVRLLYRDIQERKRFEVDAQNRSAKFQVQDAETDAFVKSILGVPEGKTKSVYDNPRLQELTKEAQGYAKKIKDNGISISEASQRIEALDFALDEHPGKFLHKYANKKEGRLPEVTGTGTSIFSRRGDNIAEELGFEDGDAANEAYQGWLSMKEQKKSLQDDIEALQVGMQMAEIRGKKANTEIQKIMATGDTGEDIVVDLPEMTTSDIANAEAMAVGDISALPDKEMVKGKARVIEKNTVLDALVVQTKQEGFVAPKAEKKESALSKQMREEIKKDLDIDIDANKVQRTTNLEQVDKALELVDNDIDKAIRIAMGEEPAPEGILNSAVLGILRKKAFDNKDTELAKKLAQSEIGTLAGQEVQFFKTFQKYDPVAKIEELFRSKEARAKETTGKTAKKAVKEGVKEASKIQVKLDKPAIARILDSITC